jgi:tetratricopeptide (TPR) repeat protein
VLLFTPPQPYIWFAFAAGSGLVARRLRVWKLRINRPLKYLVLIVAMVSFVVSTYSTYEVLAANYYYQQFFESMHSGNLTQASEILEKAISLLPKENRFLIEKAVFYSKVYGIGAGDLNYVQTALEALEKAQENNPYSFEVALLKSDVLLQMGDLGEKPSYENALSTAKVAIYLSPYDAKGYYQLGLAYAGLNQIDRAIAAWQKAVSLKSDYAEAYYSLGYAYEVKNDIKSALKFYNLARRFASEQDKAVIEESIQRLKSKQK